MGDNGVGGVSGTRNWFVTTAQLFAKKKGYLGGG
jgi:hypothetical protein